VKLKVVFLLYFFALAAEGWGETFRTIVAGTAEVSAENPGGFSVSMGYNSSVIITLGKETRFCKGVQMELSAPKNWLSYWGSLALALYAEPDRKTAAAGTADMEARRIYFEPVPNKLQPVYQIPMRSSHGLKSSPYSTVIQDTLSPSSFPLIFRLFPVIKGLSEEVENMSFQFSVKPILSDEGAVRFTFRYPEHLAEKPFTLLVDDVLLEDTAADFLLKEGEHYFFILSDDYRNESRRFMVERSKVIELAVELRDPAPLLLFEGPRNSLVFLDDAPVTVSAEPLLVEPGIHEIMFRIGDYTITKTLTVQRGKTYRIALTVNLDVNEE
jgi:hypothetical protein